MDMNVRRLIMLALIGLACASGAVAQCAGSDIVGGTVFHDLNCNGEIDEGEPGLAGWTVTRTGSGLSGPQSDVTDEDGHFVFPCPPIGVYTVTETVQPGWEPTSPATGSYVGVPGGSLTFGNRLADGEPCDGGGTLGLSIIDDLYLLSCDSCGTVSPDTLAGIPGQGGTPGRYLITGAPGAVVLVSLVLPASVICDGGTPLPLSSWTWSQGGTSTPITGSAITVTLDDSGRAEIFIGVQFCNPSGCDQPGVGQLIADLQYVGGVTTIASTRLSYELSAYSLCPKSGCDSSVSVNGTFESGLIPGTMPGVGSVSAWSAAYGAPIVLADSGCDDIGYISLAGNKLSGSAIYQAPASAIEAGKVYEISFCARLSDLSGADYGKVRVVAFNGTIPSSGTHPGPSSSIAIIDVSGKINCDGWATETLHRWRAPKNFEKYAISVENNHALGGAPFQSIIEIDNICFAEVADSIPCYLGEFDESGNPVSFSAFAGGFDPECPAMEDTIDRYMGSVSDVYADCGAGSGVDTWYEDCPDSCASIGGELPEELTNFLLNDSLDSYLGDLGIDSAGQLTEAIQAVEDSLEAYVTSMNLLDTLFSLGAITTPCDSMAKRGPVPDPSGVSPFEGRDIVFIHGYRLTPLAHRLDGVPESMTKWPRDREEFRQGGYWKDSANSYWYDHITKYLGVIPGGGVAPGWSGPTYKNRFLVVSHAVTQPGVVALHAILDQIARAMRNHEEVVACDPANPRSGERFGQNGIVIISHSAGALFTNASMSIAKLARDNPFFSLMIGDIGVIADQVDLHIAIQGAFTGSGIAAGLLVSSSIPGLGGLVKDILGSSSKPEISDLPWLYSSQTLDMSIPHFIYSGEMFDKICALAPGPLNPACYLSSFNLIDDVPMDVVTLSGGNSSSYGISNPDPGDHNKAFQVLAKTLLYHGFDDGTLTMDGQAGNPDRRPRSPNQYLPYPGILTLAAISQIGNFGWLINERLYDMGIHRRLDNGPARAIGYYLDQKLDVMLSKYRNDLLCSLFPNSDLCLDTPPFPHEFAFASSGALPWLSPTGMRQPVAISRIPEMARYDATRRRPNHYSFLMSTADHFSGSNYLDNPLDQRFPNYVATYGINNSEEVRVTSSDYLYTSGIVNPAMKNMQGETIRGKSIGPWSFPPKKIAKWLRIRQITIGPFWIWKRKYHLLDGWEAKHQLDYVYQYVLKP